MYCARSLRNIENRSDTKERLESFPDSIWLAKRVQLVHNLPFA